MNYKLSLVKPAHNSLADYEITPIEEIANTCCIQCKEAFNEKKLIVWTRLSNGKVIWWHGREHGSDSEPCEYKGTFREDRKVQEEDPYKRAERMREKHLKQKEYYAKRKAA